MVNGIYFKGLPENQITLNKNIYVNKLKDMTNEVDFL